MQRNRKVQQAPQSPPKSLAHHSSPLENLQTADKLCALEDTRNPKNKALPVKQQRLRKTPESEKLWRNEQNDPMLIYHLDKFIKFKQISKEQLDEMARWQNADKKGRLKTLYIKEVQKRNDLILNVIEQSRLEKLQNYEDRWPCLDGRKAIQKIRIYINMAAFNVISHKAFENATITVILLNSLTLALEKQGEAPEYYMQVVETIFLVLYSFEMCMKILGMGFILGASAYLRDFWGCLDFIIVMSAYWEVIASSPAQGIAKSDIGDEEEGGANINALRAFRVLRPLRTITSIKGLRVLVTSILEAIPMLKQTVLVLFFFFLIFAIAGVQLLSGQLKNRCIVKVTGQVFEDDGGEEILCGAELCPVGTFCGKANENPANGSTNLDNIFYALLMVFQCTTLEGWSDIQTLYQETYSYYIFLYFVVMVFIGAFFLMNLTLAVINAAFSDTNKQANEPGKFDDAGGEVGPNLDDFEEAAAQAEPHDEIGISEFFIAKRAAKRMIDFLRLRQVEKTERLQEEDQLSKRVNAGKLGTRLSENDDPEPPSTPIKFHQMDTERSNAPLINAPVPQIATSPDVQSQSLRIRENKTELQSKSGYGGKVTQLSIDSHDQESLQVSLKKRLRKTTLKSRDRDRSAMPPLRVKIIEEEGDEGNLENHKRDVEKFLAGLQSERGKKKDQSPSRLSGGVAQQERVMMGMQGIRNNAWMNESVALKPMKQMSMYTNDRAEQSSYPATPQVFERLTGANFQSDPVSNTSQLQEDCDFDKIILMNPPDKQLQLKNKQKETIEKGEFAVSIVSAAVESRAMDMSFVESINKDSAIFDCEIIDADVKRNAYQSMDDIEQDSAIESDNSLEFKMQELKQQKEVEIATAKKIKLDQIAEQEPKRKEIVLSLKKRIRRYQTTEFDARHNSSSLAAPAATNFSAAQSQGEDQVTQERKEEEPPKTTSIAQIAKQKRAQDEHDKKKQLSMNEIDETFLKMNQPKDPYEMIDKKSQKIEINAGIAYKSTSQDEVFEPRIFQNKARHLASVNSYIQKPIDPNDDQSEDFDDDEYQQANCEPYQMKCCYKVLPTEVLSSDDSDAEELEEQPQPFQTVMNIGYKHHLTHLPTRFIFRRSDILVSSTLSVTLTPLERGYERKDLARMSEKELTDWINTRFEFTAKNLQHQYIPDPGYIPAYYTNQMRMTLKASLSPQFQSSSTPPDAMGDIQINDQASKQMPLNTLGPPPKWLPACLLREPLTPDQQQLLSDEERRQYNIQKAKHEGFLRTQKKQTEQIVEEPKKVTLDDARKLFRGIYYEIDEDEILDNDGHQVECKARMNKTMYLKRDEDFNALNKLEKFEEAYREVQTMKESKLLEKNVGDEIPLEIREELDLPKNMGKNQIDFVTVRDKDCNVKRKTPFWSGQDVLMDSLNQDKSEWITEFLNMVRVWPKGFFGLLKKVQCMLKIVAKSSIFDHSMLISVLMNTFVMASEAHENTKDFKDKLESANLVFTYIFIFEMGIKLLSIGPKKYVMETMNIIDGSVVLLSIVELSMTTGGDGSQLSAFRTIRILRTLRVLRVVRILRALKSMGVIIAVFRRSFGSFMYIAMLLMVCCFIFTLLGKTIFGAKFDYEPRPRGNFDTFTIAFITVFQILTMENWQTVAFDSMRSEVGKWVPAIYYIVWIFLGNFILLNLFLAILLDSFVEEDEQSEMSEEMQAKLELEKQERKDKREADRMQKIKRLGQSMFKSGNVAMLIQREKKPKAAFANITNLAGGNMMEEMIVDNIEDLDAEAIREMFLDQGILKDKTNKRKQRQMYQGVSCKLSFYIFRYENQFRKFCYSTAAAAWFDKSIILLITLNSIKLGADSYFLEEDIESPIMQASEIIDYLFNIAFAIECFLKCIGQGFVMDQGSYLRDGWNQLDFFIVVTSLTDMILSFFISVDIGFFKILRLLRTLRPLRVISHNIAMKMIVSALFDSVGAIFNVMVVVLCVWLMFAILAINLLSGKSFYCSRDMYGYHNKYDCNLAGGSWERYDSNYDNISQAMMTLFIVSTLEGWPDVMIQSVDSTEVNNGPRMETSKSYIYFYIIFIFVGSFFLLNFFIGVLFLEYEKAQKEERKGYTEAHTNWIVIQQLITSAQVDHAKVNMPDKVWRFKIWRLVNSNVFDITIMVFIVLNMVQMACDFEGAPPLVVILLRLSNYIFTFVFFSETVLKLLAYGWSYFHTSWNKFDFFVVAASLFDLGLEFIDAEDMKDLPIGNVARVLRVMRVSRVLRLAKKSEDLQQLIETISMSVQALLNVFGLLLLILFMFAVLGVFFFNEVSSGLVINDYKNFKNFGSAYLLLFAIATGEDWNRLMYDCMKTPPDCVAGETCGWNAAPLYYISFIMVITHVMLNLFILVIIQQFEEYYVAENNPIKTFKTHFDEFHSVWVDKTQRFKCAKIKERMLVDFFLSLAGPMGMKPSSTTHYMTDPEVKKQILKMGIRSDDGWIFFNELLYRCMRRVYSNFKLNKRMQITELRTLFKISLISMKAKDAEGQANSESVFEQIINKSQSVNPFLTMMYYRISFNTWLNAARKNKAQHDYAQNPLGAHCPCIEQKSKGTEVQIEVEEIVEYTSDEEDDLEIRRKKEVDALTQKSSTSPSKPTKSKTLKFKEDKKEKKNRKKLIQQGRQSSPERRSKVRKRQSPTKRGNGEQE